MNSVDTSDTVHGAIEMIDSIGAAQDQEELAQQVLSTNEDNDDKNENSDEDNFAISGTATTTTNTNTMTRSSSSLLSFIVKCGINCVLPFINGVMLGFGEIVAHELCFRSGWRFARVQPSWRMQQQQQRLLKQEENGAPIFNSVLTR